VSTSSTDAYKNMKVPGFLHQDPRDRSRMFLIGMWNKRASVLKFNKKNAGIDWKLEIKEGDSWVEDNTIA